LLTLWPHAAAQKHWRQECERSSDCSHLGECDLCVIGLLSKIVDNGRQLFLELARERGVERLLRIELLLSVRSIERHRRLAVLPLARYQSEVAPVCGHPKILFQSPPC